MRKAMGNGCCGLLRPSGPTIRRARTNGNQECNYIAMNKEEGALGESDKSVKFGPMLLKESTCRTALLIAASTDDGFFGMQNVLAKAGWQSAVASSEEEAEERFTKLWPHLVIIDARKASNKQQKSLNVEHIVRKLHSLSEEDGTLIFVIVEKLSSDDKQHTDLLRAGASKILKCCPKTLADELYWIERTVLPIQLRLRSCAALFSALEHVDNAVEITSSDRIVQFVNSKYEQLTGCHKDEVLGTQSSDLRRKSLPKEGRGTRAAPAAGSMSPSANDPNKLISSARPPSPTSPRSLTTLAVEHAVDDPAWTCISVPGPSSQHCIQFVHVKPTHSGLEGGKNGFYHRPPSLRFTHPNAGTPVSEIIGLLKDVQKRCEHDEEIQKPIQQAVTILNSTELYSPSIRFKNEDKVASDLFGGLVLNGPVSNFARGRKTSLSEAMRADISKINQRGASGLLRCMSPDVRAVLQMEETWQFDIFDLERLTFRRPLVHLGMKILQRWRVREFLQCTESCLRAWLEVIEAHYHPTNPYHNSTHAADVLQATAYYLGKENIANMIEHSDAVAALLASIVHDVDHPGKGSAFLINTKHPLALLYNDVSVLESHHAALGFQLSLNDHHVNIFARLSRQDYSNMRKSIVDMVLATDMNKHFDYLAKFQQTILGNEAKATDAERLDPRRTVCRLLIKCADVSNPTRPWVQCKDWAYRIVEEYFVQTAEERAKGLPLTMEVFDRDTCNVPRTQCSFIDMFIREMFQGWSKFGNMPELLQHIEENYKHWQEEAEIWPEQRTAEFENIQRYLKQHDALRHIGYVSTGISAGRASVDSTGAGVNTFLISQQREPRSSLVLEQSHTLVTTAEGSDDESGT